MPYHLYVCPEKGKGYLEHITFIEYLRNHPEDMYAYGELKLALAEQYKTDINSYVKGKEAFIQDILQKANKVK